MAFKSRAVHYGLSSLFLCCQLDAGETLIAVSIALAMKASFGVLMNSVEIMCVLRP